MELPLTVRVPVMEVVAKVERPLTVKAVAEALPKLDVAVATMEEKEGLLLRVTTVEVPIKTCCPPLMERLAEETVRLPRVVVPMPPLEVGITPVRVMLGVSPPEEAMLPEPVTLVT